MKSRYVTLPKATVDENMDADATLSLSQTVFEADRGPINTGLLDKRGVKLYRMPESRPIGFLAKWDS